MASAFESGIPTVEGAIQLWTGLAKGFEAAGYEKVVPEYLRLSRLLSQMRVLELIKGQGDPAQWTTLRGLARAVLLHLNPLVEAAKVLAELPLDIAAVSAPEHLPKRKTAPVGKKKTGAGKASAPGKVSVGGKIASSKKASPQKAAVKKKG